ncbi:MAG: hypothetical protein ACLUNZ_10350 [Evtepia sp.]
MDLTDEQKQTAMDGAKTKADSMLAAVQAGTAFNTAAQDVLDETSPPSLTATPNTTTRTTWALP